MALVLTDAGAAAILKAVFNNVWPAGGKNLTLKLFANNYTPVDTSAAGSFTEAAGGGYASKTLTNGSWTESNVAGIEQVLYASQTFSFTGPLTTNPNVYGYYVVDADGVVWWAESQAMFTPTNNGDNIVVPPLFQASKGTPA
jgi:hypothetical protein